MNPRILIAVIITIALYALWSWWSVRSEEGFAPFNINSQDYAPEMPESPPIEARLDRIIAPSGPSSPTQAPPAYKAPSVVPPETPFDPQSQSFESAELPERLRHPERLYGPGLVNDESQVAVDSGIANAAAITDKQFQSFGPEFAQNGGFFMENVLANDSSVPSSYSSV